MKTLKQNTGIIWRVMLAFAAIYFVWGSTYMAIMVALESFPPFILAGIRFFTAGLLLFGWCILNREIIPSFGDIIKLSFAGILLLFFGSGSVIWVEQYLPSSLTSIIWASLPIWFLLLDKREWPAHFSNVKVIIGLFAGFAGVLILLGDNELLNLSDSIMKLVSFFVAIGGTIIFALGSLYIKYRPVKGSLFTKASIQMIAAGLLSMVLGLIIGEHDKMVWNIISVNSILSLLYLIVMGSLVAYLAYVWLITVMPPAIVGTFTYVNPTVAVFLGWSMLDEIISMQQLVALLMILAGVLIVNIYKSKFLNQSLKS